MSVFFLMYIWLISFDHEQLIARKAVAEKIRTAMGMLFNKVLFKTKKLVRNGENLLKSIVVGRLKKKAAIVRSSLKMKKNSTLHKKREIRFLSKQINLEYKELKETQKKENNFVTKRMDKYFQ